MDNIWTINLGQRSKEHTMEKRVFSINGITNVGEDVEKREPLYNVGGTVN